MNKQLVGKKTIHPEALIRARSCLKAFAENIQRHKPEKILAMATSAARDATNAAELFDVGRELNIPIEIIPGSWEAEITYQVPFQVQKNLAQTFLVIDIGGGSTEIILGQGSQVLFSQSLNIGCVRLTEDFCQLNQLLRKNSARFGMKLRSISMS